MRGLFCTLFLCLVAGAAWAEQVIHVTDAPQAAPDSPAASPEVTPDEGEDEAAPDEAPPAEPKKAPAAPAPEAKPFNAVRLQGLDKVTARLSTIDAPLGVVTRFENLEIIALRCWQAPPEDQPENAALLDIRELKQGVGPVDIFKGWMFASSPAVSALEHPVYDVTVIECEHLDKLE